MVLFALTRSILFRLPTTIVDCSRRSFTLSSRIISQHHLSTFFQLKRKMSSASNSSSATTKSSPPSTPSTINLAELLSVCYDLSEHAGQAIRRIFDSGQLGAIEKDTTAGSATHATSPTGQTDFGSIVDPQTLADLESQRIIIGNLSRIYGPGLKIVGEEGELEASQGEGVLYRDVNKDRFKDIPFPEELKQLSTADLTLWIDPLDGTKEFTLGFVHYVTVLIGISYRTKALAGVVHIPFIGGKYIQKHDPLNPTHQQPPQQDHEGKTIWGAVGVGVHGMEVAKLDELPKGRRWVTTTRTHFSDELKQLLEKMKPEAVIRCGGAGSKGLLVLAGDADAYVYPQTGTKRWDTCAIDALTRAVGGKFTDAYGDDIIYDPQLPPENADGLLATLQHHDLYVLPKSHREEAKKKAATAAAAKSHL